MWILFKPNDSMYSFALLAKKIYIVGRSDADITLNDRSISRHHARLSVEYNADLQETRCIPKLKIQDLSKFGTFVTGRALDKGDVLVNVDSYVTFGQLPGVTLKAEFHPLRIVLSSVPVSTKVALMEKMNLLCATLLEDWEENCNLLITPRLIVTHKVLCALLSGVAIVHPNYLDTLLEASMRKPFCKPDYSKYLPPVEEKGFTSADDKLFLIDPHRREIFEGRSFYFLTEKKLKRYEFLLGLTKAKIIRFTSPEALSSDLQVGSQNDVIRKLLLRKFLAEKNFCVLYESTGDMSSLRSRDGIWFDLIYSVLQEVNLRPVLDQEIAFSIVQGSCERFCNPKQQCDERILSQLGIPKEYSTNALIKFSVTDELTTRDLPYSKSDHLPNLKRPRDATEALENTITGTSSKRRNISVLFPRHSGFDDRKTTLRHQAHVLVPDTEALVPSSPASNEMDSHLSSTSNSFSADLSRFHGKSSRSQNARSKLPPRLDPLSNSPNSIVQEEVAYPTQNADSNEFDSLPSLDSLLNRIVPKFPLAQSSVENSLLTSMRLLGSADKIIHKSNNESTNVELDKENIPVEEMGNFFKESEPDDKPSISNAIGDFLSKEKGLRLYARVAEAAKTGLKDENPIICSRIEYFSIKSSSFYQISADICQVALSECMNFKRFKKVSSCESRRGHLTDSPSLTSLKLIPHLSSTKLDGITKIQVPNLSSDRKEEFQDRDRINLLFDQLTALPSVRML